MKILLLFALFASALSFDFYDLAKAEWEAYKLEYGKEYESRAIDINQMSGFLQTKKTIAEHNQKYHRGEVSYKLGINELSDLLPHQYRTTRLGLKLPADHQRSGYQFLSFGDYIQLPDSIDWRTLGAVTPPKNQGACGSCWAFSATGALEGQHFRKTGKLVSLSEQELIDCILKDFGCDGGLPDDAFRYIKQNGGIDTEESYPYLGMNSTCHFNQSNVGATDIGYVDIGHSELEIQQAVATVGPVSVAIFANIDTFMSYDGGIFDSPDCRHRIDHGVLVVGYGSENGVDYWIIKNSWGPNWGEGGYMRMVRGKNMCNIVTLASYPLV